MSRLERMEVAPGVEVWVEVPDRLDREGREAVGPKVRDVGAVKDVKSGLYQALSVIEAFGKTAAERLKGLAVAAGPDEVSIELGVGVSSEAGVVFASASAEANLKVTLTWKKAEAGGK